MSYNSRRIQKLSTSLAEGKLDTLSEEDKRVLADLETANECIKKTKKGGKSAVAKAIQKELGGSLFNAYKYFNNALELYGHLEYPGMSKNKLFALRQMYSKVAQLEKQIKKAEKAAFKVEWEKIILKYRNDINKIEGNYIQEVVGIDYTKWERPKLFITNDKRALRINKELLDKFGEEDIEDVDFEVLKDAFE